MKRSVEIVNQSKMHFYGSVAWQHGPQEAILSLIDSYTTIVLEMDATIIDSLRIMS